MVKRWLLLLLLSASPAADGAQAQVLRRADVVAAGGTTSAAGGLVHRGTVGQPIAGAGAAGARRAGGGFWFVVARPPDDDPAGVALQARVLLQGAYVAAEQRMRTVLNGTGYLDAHVAAHPYGGPPWLYDGAERVVDGFFAGHPGVVDWMLLQLRTGDPAAPPMAVAAERAALLRDDGSVVDLDGAGSVAFDGLTPGAYWLVVFHRNHLPAMSAAPLDCSGGVCAYDFTTAAGYGAAAQADLGCGRSGLWSGDADADGRVKYNGRDNDRVALAGLLPHLAASLEGYHAADLDLDGRVKYNGRDNDRTLVARVLPHLAATRQAAVPPAD